MPPIGLDQPADRPETRVVIAGIGIDLVEERRDSHGTDVTLLSTDIDHGPSISLERFTFVCPAY